MKTASGWAGRYLEIRTTMLGSGEEITVKLDWDKVNDGELDLELSTRNITVNSVAPGFIKSNMTDKLNDDQKKTILDKIPMKKLGDSVDIAKAVGFLCSENANYITGQTIHVNGGLALI